MDAVETLEYEPSPAELGIRDFAAIEIEEGLVKHNIFQKST